jgi:simple sugar transport system permease protein
LAQPRNRTLDILLTLLPILVSLVITALLILAIGVDPREVLQRVWEGAFRDVRSLSQVVNFWIPLTLVSMGLIVTFTAGLWNIGVEGQMMMGAVFATWAALYLPLPSPVLIPIEILLAMLGGMLWAAVVGVLKTWLRVHEIFGGVALNALSNILAIYLISNPWRSSEGGTELATPPFRAEALFPPLSPQINVNLLTLLVTIGVIAAVIFALRRTRWGLQLKAVGKNARSALLLGVPTARSTMSAFLVCGAVAGLGGAYRVLFTFETLRPSISGGIGFLGLLVVLLVSMRALWAPLVAFAFAAILGGSTRLRVALQLDSSLAGVLQGILVLTALLTSGLRERIGLCGEADADTSPAPETLNEVSHE